MRSLPFALSLILVASSGAAARDAGILPVAGDAASAARLAGVFGTVTSIHRTIERNRLVGGVPNSYHLSGRAIDVARLSGLLASHCSDHLANDTWPAPGSMYVPRS